MTVSKDDIAMYSTWTVTTSGPFTEALFTEYKAKAQVLLDIIDPGLSGEAYDWVHALIICHMYELKLGTIEVRSVVPGEWEFIQPGVTGFWIQAMNIIKLYKEAVQKKTPYTREAVTRADAAPGFKLDKNPHYDPFMSETEVRDALGV